MERNGINKMRTCPVGIEIVMHLYYSPEASPFEGTRVFDDVTKELEKEGVVKWLPYPASKWKLTEKGNAWVELICSTPYPVAHAIWKDPRTNESISSM